MSTTDKTSRCFNFLLWLLEAKEGGIAVDYILQEYQISKKTFLRDIKELNKISDLLDLKYNTAAQRVYAHWKGGKEGKGGKLISMVPPSEGSTASAQKTFPTLFHQLKNKTTANNDEVCFSLNTKFELKLEPYELTYLLNGIIKREFVNFTYHQKERDVVPLMFCEYAERWYLLALVHPIGKVLKFRVDEIEKVQLKRYRQPLSLFSLIDRDDDIDSLKQRVLKVIQFSQNVFVDLNNLDTLKINFRFYFPLDFLNKEIKQFKLLDKNVRGDPGVHDVELHFHGYEEAKVFLNKWLGKYSILAPDWIAEQYISDVEEALDIIQV